jgi:hypothetical protein
MAAQPATQSTANPEPVLVFVFEVKQWTNQVSSLTKLEFIDYIPTVCSQFFFDPQVPGYVLTLGKSKWDTLSPEQKFKFKTLTRRLREEVEGVMTQAQREQFESVDPFEQFAKKREEEAAQAAQAAQAQNQSFAQAAQVVPPVAQQQKDEDNIDLKSIENALNR